MPHAISKKTGNYWFVHEDWRQVMPSIEPLALRPVLGYAMWQLQHGKTLEQVTGLLEARKEFSWMSPDDIANVLARATTNVAASDNLANAQPAWSFDRLFPVQVSLSDTVGVRILMDLKFADGHIETVSVTVNARMGMSIEAVKDRAIAFVNSGGLNRGGQGGYIGEVVDSAVFQVIEGGLENAAVNL